MRIHTYIRRNIASRRSEGDFVYQHVKDRASRTQSQARLSSVEAQPIFEAQPQRRSQHPSRFRFASAKL